jgi:hypothetical protein
MPKTQPITNNQEFLELIFGADWPRVEVCSVPVLGQDDKYRPYWATQPAKGVLSRFSPDWNNYFCVGLVNTPGLRRIENFEALRALVVDDVGPKVAPGEVQGLLGEPTYKVETSPGNEHWGYVLDPPVTDRTRGDALIDAVIDVLFGGKDPGMDGVARIMRLPFGSNTKYEPAHKARLTHATGPRHDPAELERRLPIRVKAVVQHTEPEPFDPFDKATSTSPPGPAPGPSRRPVDPTLRAMRKLGLVLGNERKASQGTGWDVRCPWVHEHTASTVADTGTMYFRGGGFKCWHGHCQDRKPEDVRARVNQMLSDETGGLFTIDDFDPNKLDAVDPETVPQSPLPPDPHAAEFWDRIIYLASEEKFINLVTDEALTERGLNSVWTNRLGGQLPPTAKGDKRLTPSQWYLSDDRRRLVHARTWAPGRPRVFSQIMEDGSRRDYLNIWRELPRAMATVPAPDLDTHARNSDWWKLIHELCGDATHEERENARRLLFYMAMIVGAPHVKPGNNPLLIGKQGVGKDQIWSPLMKVLGPERSITVSHHMWNSQFNPWMMNRLVMMPELRMTTRLTATAHDQYETIKRMCDPGREFDSMNEKNMRAVNVVNAFVLVMTTNEDKPMTLPEDDRRIWVINVKDPGWPVTRHQALAAWLNAPSPWGQTNAHAVVEWLIRFWDESIMLDEVQGPAPMTQDKSMLVKHSADPIQAWLEDRLSQVLPSPLTLPDLFTSQDIVNAASAAVRSGTEGLPPRTAVPHVDGMSHILIRLRCRVINKGNPVSTRYGRRRLWVRPWADPTYETMSGADLAQVVDNWANRRASDAFSP